MICVLCGQHFFKDKFNPSLECMDCQDVIYQADEDDISDDVFEIMNPTGKTKAYIEDADDAS